MRSLLFIISLLLLISPIAYGSTQYSVAACMLLNQQIQRFSDQPHNSSYRNARREFGKYCRNPVPSVPRETITSDYTSPARQATITEPTPSVVAKAAPKTTDPKTIAANAGESQTHAPDTNLADTNLANTNVANSFAAKSTKQVEPTPVSVSRVTKVTKTLNGAKVAEEALVTPATIVKMAPEYALPEPAIAAPEALRATPDTLAAAVAVLPLTVADNKIVAEGVLMQMLNNLPLIAANIVALLLAVFLLTSWFGLNLPGFKGAFAEYKLNRLLRWRLSRSYQHFRKLKLLTEKDELVVVDHLVLSPFGIFVIAVKSYRGRIFGSETEANWMRQYFGSSKQFMNPLHQNFKNVEAVKHLLQLQNNDALQQLHSVIAFSRVGQFKTAMPANVTYVDAVSAYHKQFTEPCLTDEQVNRYAALLSQASTGR